MSLESRITFTGSISPSETGLFRFVISDVKFHDEGQYECYVGPPDNRGFTIDNCGQTLFVMAASTVYIRFGETATLAWNLHGSGMKEFWVRNDFWHSTIFHITKYKKVNIPSRTLRSRIVFTGHITSSGTGLFRFMINDADDHDFGQYSCYKGSPQRPGAKVPNCGQNLVVIRVQEPYIESPRKATVGDSVNLTCHSFLKSFPNWNLTLSFIWSRNGTRVEHGGKHKLVSVSRSWTGGRYMTITLTISGVTKKDRGERYTCQTVVGENLLTDQSMENILDVSYIPHPHSKNTEVEVGDNVLFSMKTFVHQTKIYVISPTDRLVFEMDSYEIYIREAFWTRIKVMKVITSLATASVQFQLSDITSSDAGRYYCSVEPRGQTGCSWDHFLVVSNVTSNTVTVTSTQTSAATTTGILLSTATTANTDQNYWNLRSQRSYITPMQNMPENIDSQGYAEIDNADLLERGAGNLARPVGKIQSDDNIPPGARIRRERQQLERNCRKVDENDEYEEVKPLDTINSEELAEEQEKRAPMQQPDQDSVEDITGEMNITLPEASSYSDPLLSVADWSVHGRDSGSMTAGRIDALAETSFMTQDTDEPWDAPLGTVDTEKLSGTIEIFPEVGRMTANNAGAHQLSMEGRGDNAESEARGVTNITTDNYDSLMPHRSCHTYRALGHTTDK
ncbi:uncharacterized protein LOC124274008 [Haliotis rubra]|uniref:uncharacterized protein LOC124274008 n=1 Tax=Haliotis rubra TaxID=36100 RepID=UPI001EE5010F|nr:uncharacterized protein LOC124274008 [Haliotis rubra]